MKKEELKNLTPEMVHNSATDAFERELGALINRYSLESFFGNKPDYQIAREMVEYSTKIGEIGGNLDHSKIYIKGHPTRGAEVIKMLEDLGAVNAHLFKGCDEDFGYYITKKGNINNAPLNYLSDYTELHLPELVSEVDLPKEEVELIDGEVYACDFLVFIYKETNKKCNKVQSYVDLEIDNNELAYDSTWVCDIKDVNPASPEQRKQLFDALEKAGKHFDKTLNEDAFNSLEDENRKLKSQLKEKDINWEQEKLDICKSVLPAIFAELYREMKKKSPAIAYDYEKNIENRSINRAISLADELINQLKQQNDEK